MDNVHEAAERLNQAAVSKASSSAQVGAAQMPNAAHDGHSKAMSRLLSLVESIQSARSDLAKAYKLKHEIVTHDTKNKQGPVINKQGPVIRFPTEALAAPLDALYRLEREFDKHFAEQVEHQLRTISKVVEASQNGNRVAKLVDLLWNEALASLPHTRTDLVEHAGLTQVEFRLPTTAGYDHSFWLDKHAHCIQLNDKANQKVQKEQYDSSVAVTTGFLKLCAPESLALSVADLLMLQTAMYKAKRKFGSLNHRKMFQSDGFCQIEYAKYNVERWSAWEKSRVLHRHCQAPFGGALTSLAANAKRARFTKTPYARWNRWVSVLTGGLPPTRHGGVTDRVLSRPCGQSLKISAP